MFCQNIAAFGFHNFLKGLGQVGVKRRDKAGFEREAKFLHLRGIQGKIVFAEGTHTHQCQFAAEEIVELGQFVYPQAAHNFTPGGHAKVVFEFSALLQGVGLENVILQIFAVGVHGAEFAQIDHLAVLAQAFEADQRAVAWVLVCAGRIGFFQDEVHEAVDFALVDQFETAEIETPQHLGFREGAVLAPGECEIPALEDGKFGHHAAQKEIQEIERRTEDGAVFSVEVSAPFGDGLSVTDEDTAVFEEFAHLDEIDVQTAQVVDAMQVDKHLPRGGKFFFDVEENFGIQDQGFGVRKAV